MDSLEKKLTVCLVMTVLIVAFIPVYWLREPARQAAAANRIQQEGTQKGKDAFVASCAACHGKEGQGGAGPALKGVNGTLVKKSVRSGKGIMPAFSATQISDADLEEMAKYLSGLK